MLAPPDRSNVRIRIAAFFFSLIALVLDQATKLHCETAFLAPTLSATSRHVPSALLFALGVPPLQARLGLALPHAVTPSWFMVELTHVSNRGITLGLLEAAHPAVPVVAFYGTTLLGIAVAAVAWRTSRPAAWLPRAGALLLLTGVLANLLDRVRIGYVIDWLVIAWRMSAWQVELPAFNFGDAYIVLGLAMLTMAMIAQRFAWSSALQGSGARLTPPRDS